jgi:hypothetical protein
VPPKAARTGLRHLDNLIPVDRAARALKAGAASSDDGDSDHHHCQSGIAGRDRGDCAGVFRGRMGLDSVTYRIKKDVQLDEKKSKCGHGQAGAYPGKKSSLVSRVVGVPGNHRISSHNRGAIPTRRDLRQWHKGSSRASCNTQSVVRLVRLS